MFRTLPPKLRIFGVDYYRSFEAQKMVFGPALVNRHSSTFFSDTIQILHFFENFTLWFYYHNQPNGFHICLILDDEWQTVHPKALPTSVSWRPRAYVGRPAEGAVSCCHMCGRWVENNSHTYYLIKMCLQFRLISHRRLESKMRGKDIRGKQILNI